MHEEICYEKPYLAEAIARIDFIVPVEALVKSLSPKAVKLISSHFPISEPTEEIARELRFTADTIEHTESKRKNWNFYGKDREKQLTISSTSLFVTYKHYTTYEAMRESFLSVIEGIRKIYPDARAGRFGLRYINRIENVELEHPLDWHKYINNSLLSTHSFFEQFQLTRLFHVAETRQGDLELRFQFGMPNPDYPAIIKRPLFVLDFDAYVQVAHDLDESISHMDAGHEAIQAMFERSITQELRSKMNVKPTPSV